MIGNVNSNQSNYNNYSLQKKNTETNKFLANMSSAATKVDEHSRTEKICSSMINEPGTDIMWGMSAWHAEGSTEENPIIQVTTNYGGEEVIYNVNINEVDPRNASELEMFALGCYADDKGIGTDSTFGTYHTLKYFGANAQLNGYMENDEGLEAFISQKMDWVNMCEKMTKVYLAGGVLKQYQDGMILMNLFSKFPA